MTIESQDVVPPLSDAAKAATLNDLIYTAVIHGATGIKDCWAAPRFAFTLAFIREFPDAVLDEFRTMFTDDLVAELAECVIAYIKLGGRRRSEFLDRLDDLLHSPLQERIYARLDTMIKEVAQAICDK
jgi:hypothetical protein